MYEPMPAKRSAGEADHFLETYGAAFNGYDVDGVASHYATPSHVVSDGEPVAMIALDSAQACRAAVSRVLDWHRRLGVAGGRVRHRTTTALSPRLLLLDLHYALCDAAGADLYDFRGLYTLVREGDARWRIAAVTHNQIPRLLARLGDA